MTSTGFRVRSAGLLGHAGELVPTRHGLGLRGSRGFGVDLFLPFARRVWVIHDPNHVSLASHHLQGRHKICAIETFQYGNNTLVDIGQLAHPTLQHDEGLLRRECRTLQYLRRRIVANDRHDTAVERPHVLVDSQLLRGKILRLSNALAAHDGKHPMDVIPVADLDVLHGPVAGPFGDPRVAPAGGPNEW